MTYDEVIANLIEDLKAGTANVMEDEGGQIIVGSSMFTHGKNSDGEEVFLETPDPDYWDKNFGRE